MKLIKVAESRGFRAEVLQGSAETEVSALCYDSRKLKKGCLFVCMKGAGFDSHEKLAEAAAFGAAAAVIERDCELPEGLPVFKVPDARLALAQLSAAWFGFPADSLVTVGVTGTKGKTTTTHMIRALLERSGRRTGMIGTNGVVVGELREPTLNTTPESYELQRALAKMRDEGCSHAVMEVSSQGLMLHRTGGMRFDYGIFLNISPDHIGPSEHRDFEDYLECKARLFSQCRVGLINADDPHASYVESRASCEELFRFGEREEADFRASDLRYVSEAGMVGLCFRFSSPDAPELEARVGIPGRFNADNALAALAVCSLMGVGRPLLSAGLREMRVDGRMEVVYSGDFTLMVDYAHNAVSMEALLDTLRDYRPGRLVVVFGCGGNRAKERRYSMGRIAGEKADLSIVTADNSRYERVEDIMADICGSIRKTGGSYLEIPDRREAIFYAVSHAEPGDMIAVIGKGHEDYQEIAGVRHHFLDREAAEEALRARGLK